MTMEGGVAVYALPVRVDVSNTRDLVLPVRQGILSGQRQVVLDFSATQAVDSTALGALVQLLKAVKAAGGELVLCGVSDSVQRVFSITRLDQVFVRVMTRPEAVAKLQSSTAAS